MICGHCTYMTDDGNCRLCCAGHPKEVGYFRAACNDFIKDGTEPPLEPMDDGTGYPHMRRCKVCGRAFPDEMFSRNYYGIIRVCKTCKAEQMKEASLMRKQNRNRKQ